MRHYALKKKVLYCGVVIVILIILLHPDRNARRSYSYIAKENILNSLRQEIANNFSTTALADCDYYDVIHDDTTLPLSIAEGDLVENHRIREGGEYAPVECRPRFSTAIIVPYRDTAEQLRGFLVFMHMFLRRQHIHYRIYVVEQVDSRPFNRAKLINIGSLAAMRAGFPCLVLHDVDLLPLKLANIYACTEQPRHMSCSINKYRFVLPYLNLFDGAVSISSKQFKLVNGMSNKYFGWGGDDDDLYTRLEAHCIEMSRFEPSTSQYHMVPHEGQQKRPKKSELLANAKERMSSDGLNSLKYTEVATVLHPLFTHIMVDL
ncbi:beta-1,4-galactosyltransferase 1-like [Pararge aegeria]|uniref:Beta-1,4-N-acetylgalactosaminyltransferase n=1 Tax=Pararge aegeria aegeria TaxID=348720 RepID=A0A8S4S339_9NEOP|nr:beta-1,4-galactosyltransferase 1-like [Pararge aegeria]CAH2248087.1 jg12763 [Pararge aegeria aegeria]